MTELKTPTRKDYMEKRVTFADYYRAINKTAGVGYSGDIDKVKAALDAGDEHLNTIPLSHWDMHATLCATSLATAMKKHGDFYSLGGGVCCMKQSARDKAAK